MRRNGEWGVNPVSRAAALAGYAHCGAWLEHFSITLQATGARRRWCARELAGVVAVKTEATYLKWLDTTRTGLDEEDLMDRLINGERLLVQAGSDFGVMARGFLRLNLACPRTMVTFRIEPYRKGHRAGGRLK